MLCSTINILFIAHGQLEVEIAVLTKSGGRPSTPPSDYNLGSTATLVCYAEDPTGSVRYEWTSTSTDFFAYNSSAMFNRKRLLSAGDAGMHTCTVGDSQGNSGQATLKMIFEGSTKIILLSLLCQPQCKFQKSVFNTSGYIIMETLLFSECYTVCMNHFT